MNSIRKLNTAEYLTYNYLEYSNYNSISTAFATYFSSSFSDTDGDSFTLMDINVGEFPLPRNFRKRHASSLLQKYLSLYSKALKNNISI